MLFNGVIGRKQAMAIVFLIAGMLRLSYLYRSEKTSQIQPDSITHIQMAENIISGNGMTDGNYYSIRAPGYPLFLAAVFKLFGKSMLAVQLVQIIISLVSCWFVYKISRFYFSREVSFLAFTLYSVSYGAFSLPGQILTECLYVFFLLSAFYFMLKEKYVLTGFLFAIGYFFRQEILIFALFVVLVEVAVKKRIVHALKLLLPMMVLISVWGTRNYIIHQKFIIGTTSTFEHLYESNIYIFERMGWKVLPEIPNAGKGLGELELNQLKKERCRVMFSQQPLYRLIIAPFLKLGFFLYPFLPEYDVTYVWILPFWILGMARLSREFGKYWQFYGIFIILVALMAVFHAIPRFRNIFLPFMVIFASVSLVEEYKKGGYMRTGVVCWFFGNIVVYFFSPLFRTFVKGILP